MSVDDVESTISNDAEPIKNHVKLNDCQIEIEKTRQIKIQAEIKQRELDFITQMIDRGISIDEITALLKLG